LAEVSFGEWLKRRRKAAGLTQEQLAGQLNCSTITLRKIEAEERRPSSQIVERLSELFEISSNEQPAFLRFARGDWKSAPTKLTEEAPWRVSTTDSRSNLPASITSLIGREHEIAALHEYLSNHDIRLVTLIGPPGIGKTRLSVATAREVFSDFPDGVFFVALAPLEDPSLVAPTIVQTLGFVETKNQSILEQLKGGIGDKQMLIVLDNCEHLIEAVASVASDILSACSRLKIIATSREALRIPGEWLYSVPTLDVPKEGAAIDTQTVSEFPALTLFAERARAARHDFALNADNIQFVASICAQLDGLPLAIELLAARMRLMSPQSLLERWSDQFILSADGMRAVSPRQKTLNNAIGWSYNLLSAEEQKLFACLSIFSGGFMLEAAETIFSRIVTGKPISDLIASLLDKSLLQRTLNEEGEPRFNMLVTIQQFALDQLHHLSEESEVRDRHLDYFLELAEAGASHLYSHGQEEWLAHLQAEMDNFRAAFEWSLIRKIHIEKSLRLVNALFKFWRVRSESHQAQRWFETVLNLPEVESYPIPHAKAVLNMGILKLLYVNAEVAEPLFVQSIMLARALGNHQMLAEALDFLGTDLGFQKKFDQASSLLEESLSLFRAANDQRGIALSSWHLGWVSKLKGDQAAALQFMEKALKLFEELGDTLRQSILLREIGACFLDVGELQRGKAMLRQALSTAYNVGSKLEMGNAFGVLSFAEEQQGNFTKSAQLLWTAQKLYGICGAQGKTSETELVLNRLRNQLDQTIFDAAVTQAQSWTLEQAIAYA
jgi:predicted ATPase/transcriptional regulator with XRE-family HTH domain